jgi:hypothetical protein
VVKGISLEISNLSFLVRIQAESQNAVIAQLVERYLGMVKVIGSSPIGGSEKSSKKFGETKRITNFVKQKRSLT